MKRPTITSNMCEQEIPPIKNFTELAALLVRALQASDENFRLHAEAYTNIVKALDAALNIVVDDPSEKAIKELARTMRSLSETVSMFRDGTNTVSRCNIAAVMTVVNEYLDEKIDEQYCGGTSPSTLQ